MRSTIITLLLLLTFLFGYASTFTPFEESRRTMRAADVKGLTLPPVVIKIMSMEFRNIAADFLFVRASQFLGSRVEGKRALTKDDWMWLYHNLDVVTELDPYFQDPYYVANGLLVWDAGMYDEANALLKKAVDARTWDWWFPFMLGFNKYYFQGKNKEGADYLLLASKRPGAWPMLTTLASKLYYEGGKTEAAISFLTAILKNENDEAVRKKYSIRLDALKRILYLERAAALYEDTMGVFPRNLNVLIEAGIIKKIPEDPYGGQFYIDKDGAIKTTSKLAFATTQNKKR